MHKFFLIVLLCICSLSLHAQGWPANYKGVMLQGFYWDSYADTNWAKLTEQSDELSQYFDLIWIPNSAKTSTYYYNSTATSMGYDPCFWLDQNSCWGSEEELRNMIATFKEKGTGFIADVVINHKNGLNSWSDFPQESVVGTTTGKTYSINWNYDTTSNSYPEVCSGDEGFTNSSSPMYGGTGGNSDTGDNFDGYRDLDHTNATVQENVETYLDYLLNEIGYAGFRYDMVKGYDPQYTRIYNTSAKPTYSVGEYWDGKDAVASWIKNTGYSSAAFDFGLKTAINSTFGSGNWDLSDKGIAADVSNSQYAITFVDNHDTYRDASIPLKNNILAANAFILALPGTPCIFWPHWVAYKEELKKMIAARKEAGISNTSKIIRQEAVGGGYVTVVQGDTHNIMVISGYAQGVSTDGYTAVSTGTTENPNYAYYISTGKNITIYVKADAAPYLYVWADSDTKLNGTWPGTQMSNQKYIGSDLYYYTTISAPTESINCIFNNGNGSQTTNITGITTDAYFSYDGSTNATSVSPAASITTLTSDDGIYAYFTAPASWSTVYAWAWSDNENYTGGTWPGQSCSIVGQDAEGNNIWKWKYSGDLTALPNKIIFNQGNNGAQTADLDFVNGGCYTTTGYQYTAIDTTDATNNIFERQFTKDYHSTICLPFSLDEDELSTVKGTVYAYTSESDGILHFNNVSSVEAYHPYVFIASETGKCFENFGEKSLANGVAKSITKGNFTFTGNLESRNLVSGNGITYFGYRGSDGTFVKVGTTKGVTISPYRAFFSTTTNVQAKSSVFENNETGISTVVSMSGGNDNRVYNLNGVVVSRNGSTEGLPKGVYILNHHKIIVK
ncbi:MAG: starch-binding protein [Prevotella sp.]|jgi:alpha-amylase